MSFSFENFRNKIRQEIDGYLDNTPFLLFENLVFQLTWLIENGDIKFAEDKTGEFVRFVSIDIAREFIGFISDIRAGSFGTCYHHLRKIIEVNASFCFVLKHLESESQWMARYLTYPKVWRFQKLCQYNHLQAKCRDFADLEEESLTWPQLYEADALEKILDWRGYKKGKRFSIDMLFECAQSVIKKELKIYTSESELYGYYYDYLCNQIHFSLVKESTLKTRIFGFSENEFLLKEVLRESSLEFMRFLAIGLHFKKMEINNLCWQKIESDYRSLNKQLSSFPSNA